MIKQIITDTASAKLLKKAGFKLNENQEINNCHQHEYQYNDV
ncbi:hypothetical protein [Flavobacterium soyangense]|nr:hypothetical protein [Flavobacterium soyangense]